MNLIINISLRNLLRQKRRSILLGIAIAFGMLVLVLSNSFSNGISDVLLNKIVVYTSGHLEVFVSEEGKYMLSIIRDKDRFVKTIKENVSGIREIWENITVFCRIIGNGKSDNIVMVGAEGNKEFFEWFPKILSGNVYDYINKNIENPIILSDYKAGSLNVKVNDIVKVRFKNINGQSQAARLTVIAIVKQENTFMDYVLFLETKSLKKLMGYRPYETGGLQIILKDPKTSIEKANKLHKALKPNLAMIYGKIEKNDLSDNAIVFGFKKDNTSIEKLTKNFTILQGDIKDTKNDNRAILSKSLADKLKAKPGDIITLNYKDKFEGKLVTEKFAINAVFESKNLLTENVLLINEDRFYKIYNQNLPETLEDSKKILVPEENNPVFSVLAPEWKLLPRTGTSKELEKKMKDLSKDKVKSPVLDVRSMYESASAIIKLEYALNLITVVAVLILFFIILIGVVNTLRMTIRERTREIGTIRAIGMQKNDVRNSFILETFLLAFFSTSIGIVLAFIVMKILSSFTFETESALGILLVNKHLYFLPKAGGIGISLIIILLIVVVTAYFPAKRAANLQPSTALRHFE